MIDSISARLEPNRGLPQTALPDVLAKPLQLMLRNFRIVRFDMPVRAFNYHFCEHTM
jgi:hypothetical protein